MRVVVAVLYVVCFAVTVNPTMWFIFDPSVFMSGHRPSVERSSATCRVFERTRPLLGGRTSAVPQRDLPHTCLVSTSLVEIG